MLKHFLHILLLSILFKVLFYCLYHFEIHFCCLSSWIASISSLTWTQLLCMTNLCHCYDFSIRWRLFVISVVTLHIFINFHTQSMQSKIVTCIYTMFVIYYLALNQCSRFVVEFVVKINLVIMLGNWFDALI